MTGTQQDEASIPWLICQTKLARFLEVSFKILQDSALFLQKIAKILKKLQEMQDLGRFLKETSNLFIFLARIVCKVYQTFPCMILSRNLEDFSGLAR